MNNSFSTNNNDLAIVKVRILKNLSTRNVPDEDNYKDFETISDLNTKKNFYPKGTIIKARIETVSQNKAMGVPADLTVGNFSINGSPLGR